MSESEQIKQAAWQRLVYECIKYECHAKNKLAMITRKAKAAGNSAVDGARAAATAQDLARHMTREEKARIRQGLDVRGIARIVEQVLSPTRPNPGVARTFDDMRKVRVFASKKGRL